MKSYDIVVVGGSAAGLTAALTARRHHPEKTVLLIRKEEQVLIPCGIPYIFGTVGTPDKNLIPDAVLEKNSIDLMLGEVRELDRSAKSLKLAEAVISYDRLILATGSLPVIPGSIEGIELDGVYPVYKDVQHLENIQQKLKTARHVVIVGGGFIGIEFADEINSGYDCQVTVIEIAHHCLNLSYDDEFCIQMEQHIESRGIKVRTGSRVTAFRGNGQVEIIELEDGMQIPAEVVLLGMGSVSNIAIAEKAGLPIGKFGAIVVDNTMKTADDNIYACGDCAKKWSFFAGRPSTLKLASIATLEARIAGANLYGIKRENAGTIGAWSTAVGDLAMGTAGLTEKAAQEMGYHPVAVTVESANRHPGGMPGMATEKLKLVFDGQSGRILGGQVSGDSAAGEITNIVSACVLSRMTAEQMVMFQMATHPALTASPIASPLVNAAEQAVLKLKKIQG